MSAHLPPLGARAQNRALLARQLLLERSTTHDPENAVEHLVGLQAQAMTPPYYALRSRLEDFDPQALGRLLTERRAVRMTLMRNTVHLVTAQDALCLRALMQPAIERNFRGTFRRRLGDIDPNALARAAREVMERAEGPLTGREIAARLLEQGFGTDLDAARYAVASFVPLVQVPPRGVWGASGQARYLPLEAWTGRRMPTDPSIDDLVIRYLRAFGPASVKDLQKWSGLTRCQVVFERLRDRLVSFRGEAGQELFDVPDGPRPDPDTPAPVRLLGEFDNVLLSHAERAHVAPAGLAPWMDPTQNGNRHVNTVLIDGRLRATWWIERQREKSATLVIRTIGRITGAERTDLLAEADGMVAFAAADAAATDIRIEPA